VTVATEATYRELPSHSFLTGLIKILLIKSSNEKTG